MKITREGLRSLLGFGRPQFSARVDELAAEVRQALDARRARGPRRSITRSYSVLSKEPAAQPSLEETQARFNAMAASIYGTK